MFSDLPDELGDVDVVEVDGVVCPGFVDAHVHVESSGLSPPGYARVVSERGVTSVVWDPHEVVNVAGEEGLRWALRTAERARPFKFYLALPSCVPALGEPFETVRGKVTPEIVERYADHPMVVALGEMMDVEGVLEGRKDELVRLARRMGLRVDGHAPGLVGPGAARYFSAGPETDHECSTGEEFRWRRELGVWTFVREGSSSRDLEAALEALDDLSGVCFVTDDLHASDMDEVSLAKMVRRAVEAGFDPLEALGTVTLNPSLCYGLRTGRLAPGYHADVVVLSGLEEVEPRRVFLEGTPREDAEFEGAEAELPRVEVSVDPEDIGFEDGRYRVRCVGVRPGTIRTREVVEEITIRDGRVVEEGVAFLVVVDRYGEGSWSLGFLEGIDDLECALVTTVAHDAHNVVVVGRDLRLVREGVRLAGRLGGCVGVVWDGGCESVELDVAGLMSSREPEEFVEAYGSVLERVRELSDVEEDPFQVLSFVTLPVVPEVRLTDRGMVRVEGKEVRLVNPVIEDLSG